MDRALRTSMQDDLQRLHTVIIATMLTHPLRLTLVWCSAPGKGVVGEWAFPSADNPSQRTACATTRSPSPLPSATPAQCRPSPCRPRPACAPSPAPCRAAPLLIPRDLRHRRDQLIHLRPQVQPARSSIPARSLAASSRCPSPGECRASSATTATPPHCPVAPPRRLLSPGTPGSLFFFPQRSQRRPRPLGCREGGAIVWQPVDRGR